MAYSFQKFEFFIIYNFKCDIFFALNDVIHVRTLRHINNDITKCAMSKKNETIGAEVEKVMANPDDLLPKFSLRSNIENEYPHFVFLSSNKKVTGV